MGSWRTQLAGVGLPNEGSCGARTVHKHHACESRVQASCKPGPRLQKSHVPRPKAHGYPRMHSDTALFLKSHQVPKQHRQCSTGIARGRSKVSRLATGRSMRRESKTFTIATACLAIFPGCGGARFKHNVVQDWLPLPPNSLVKRTS